MSANALVTDNLSDVALAFGIIDEINSFRAICAEDPRRGLEESDAWLQFPHPSGQGFMLVGPGVRPVLIELTKRSLSRSDLYGRVDFDEAFRTLMREFAARFIAGEQSIEETTVAALLSFTAAEMTARLADWDVFIPVRFAFQTEDARVRLGDVELLPRCSLKRELRKEMGDRERATFDPISLPNEVLSSFEALVASLDQGRNLRHVPATSRSSTSRGWR